MSHEVFFDSTTGPALVRWHKAQLNGLMHRFQLTPYAVVWISAVKGALLVLILEALFEF